MTLGRVEEEEDSVQSSIVCTCGGKVAFSNVCEKERADRCSVAASRGLESSRRLIAFGLLHISPSPSPSLSLYLQQTLLSRVCNGICRKQDRSNRTTAVQTCANIDIVGILLSISAFLSSGTSTPFAVFISRDRKGYLVVVLADF